MAAPGRSTTSTGSSGTSSGTTAAWRAAGRRSRRLWPRSPCCAPLGQKPRQPQRTSCPPLRVWHSPVIQADHCRLQPLTPVQHLKHQSWRHCHKLQEPEPEAPLLSPAGCTFKWKRQLSSGLQICHPLLRLPTCNRNLCRWPIQSVNHPCLPLLSRQTRTRNRSGAVSSAGSKASSPRCSDRAAEYVAVLATNLTRVPLDKSEGVVKGIVFLCGAKHRWGLPERLKDQDSGISP